MSVNTTEAADLFRRKPDRYFFVGRSGEVAYRKIGNGPDVLIVNGWHNHITSVRAVVDQLQLDRIAVVGHDSGGLIARHALAGDARLRALWLIDSEQTSGPSWRFRTFLAGRHLPGYGAGLGWVAGRRRLRRSRFILGGAFQNSSLLDGEFDEFFLQPLSRPPDHHPDLYVKAVESWPGPVSPSS